jgi:hypothetical protein
LEGNVGLGARREVGVALLSGDILAAVRDLRLGDVIDDYCVKCRRLTNHSIVSLVDGDAAKVRCRTCYSDHNYLREQIPPSKKELQKQKLFEAVLSGASAPASDADPSAGTAAAPAKAKKKKA